VKIVLDFETQSASDLKKEGPYKYSLHPTTRATCLAYKVPESEHVWLLDFEEVDRPWIRQDVGRRQWWEDKIKRGYLFSAHNAFFERCIYENVLVARLGWPPISPRQWRCTAAKAAACALPRGLDRLGEALKLRTKKDRGGYSAMMATCKPTKAWKAWRTNQEKAPWRVSRLDAWKEVEPEPPMFLTPEMAPDVFRTLYDYCEIDVLAEEEADGILPDLNAEEQEIWFLNQEINWRGLRVDIPTVKKVVAMMATDFQKKSKELDSLTAGLVQKPGAIKSILEFLELEGVKLPNLRAQTVTDELEGFKVEGGARRLLELRKALSLTSTKKYQSFLNRACDDDRVRDITMYHGASTGRESGTGVQPQNFPKPVVDVDPDRPYAHVENVAECSPEMLHLLYGDTLPVVFSSVLRNMILPSEGCELFVGDFSLIEVAVCWWLAGDKKGLQLLKDGRDPYIYQAAENTGKTYEEIERAYYRGENWAAEARQLGKAQTLGAQFGMGGAKFRTAAWDMYRLNLTEEQSKLAIQNYRRAHPEVPALWKAYEQAAVTAVETAGSSIHAGNCDFRLKDKFLWITLPSGRKLAYREPQIAWRETEWGPRKTLEFWAVNSKTKKWCLERTWGGTLVENVVQAVARDLLMWAILRLEKAGYRVLLTVHDEAICERKVGEGSVEEFNAILTEIPDWAEGCPVRAKSWKGPRYRK
jgi:DNA polymerase bacteriophage-type